MKIKLSLLFSFLVFSFTYAQNQQPYSIQNVFFIGNKSLSQKSLLGQIDLKTTTLFSFNDIDFDRRLLKLDAISIKNFYNSKGFLEAVVKDSFEVQNEVVDIFFIINEGVRYYLNDVKLIGSNSIKDDEVLSILGLRKDSPYNPIGINKNLVFLDEKLQEKGKLFALFDIKQIIRDSVNLEITINEGQDIFINNTWITGNELIDTSIVRREIIYNKGDLFRKSLIEKTKRNIFELNLLSSLNIVTHPISDNDSLVNIEIRVREYENRGVQNFDIGSYDIEYVPGISSMIGFGGSVNLTERMVFETKNKFDAKGAVVMPTEEGFIYPRFSFDIKLSNQRPFSLRFPIQIEFFYQQFKNYGAEQGPYVRRFGLQYSNIFRWDQNRSFLEMGLRFERFDESESLFKDEIEQRKLKLHFNIDKRDNPIYPEKGTVIQFKLDTYGGILGGERSFSKIDIDFRAYSNLFDAVNIAGRFNFGQILNWKENYNKYETILFEKFYLGGSNTLRAYKPLKFKQDTISIRDLNTNQLNDSLSVVLPLGQTAKFLTNWEIRLPFSGKIGIVLFYDGGFTSNNLQSLNSKLIIWNRGIGITYNSPFGPLRIDYGENINNSKFNQLHFGFGYSF